MVLSEIEKNQDRRQTCVRVSAGESIGGSTRRAAIDQADRSGERTYAKFLARSDRRRVVVFQVEPGLDEIDTVIKGTWRHGGPVRGMHGWQMHLMGWRVCTLKPTRWHTCALEALDQLHCLIVVCMAAGCLKLSHGKSIRSNEGT